MGDMLNINFTRPIPLFPLPDCVLLPHATVPLHIFEQRYRTMTHNTLESSGLIAMATFQGSSWKKDYQKNPPIREYVCVGVIIRHECLQDGRYNILLQGLCRARILKEIENPPYRVAALEPTGISIPMEIDLEDRRNRLEQLLADPLLLQLRSVGEIRNLINSEIPTTVMVDLVILATSTTAEERYAMLAQPDPQARADWLETYLRQTRQTIRIAGQTGTSISKDGFYLN